eukprot:1913152-Alexandrium_andersonii.AAC.1
MAWWRALRRFLRWLRVVSRWRMLLVVVVTCAWRSWRRVVRVRWSARAAVIWFSMSWRSWRGEWVLVVGLR